MKEDVLIHLGLSLFLAISGHGIIQPHPDCSVTSGLLGGFISGTNLIEICSDNVKASDQDFELVLRHEMIHAIQENLELEESLIPEPFLTWIVLKTLAPDEVMTVLLYEMSERSQEFEARIGSRLPNWLIGSALWVSEYRYRMANNQLALEMPWEILPPGSLFWSDHYALVTR
ncbi:MAG: hypothetical protein EBZ24_02655 [Synechococcaceae bacterium WB9_4xB_025]|nr:hypothetical protein [Synechococcaceae bacterium WB9_4xB_025]